MELLAIGLIGTGLACLGFVAFSFSRTRRFPEPTVGPSPGGRNPANRPAGGRQAFDGGPAQIGESSPDPQTKGAAPPAKPLRSIPESEHDGADPSSVEAGRTPAGPEQSNREELSLLRDQLTGLRRIDPDSLNEALRVFEKTERETPEPAPQLVVTGVLYLDHGRRIPHQLGRRGEIPARFFSELRRVGNGTLILENSSFLIHSGNASYAYSAGDMDQILFQGSGLALVPIHPDRPIPLFLTREVERVKAYIKKNARIRAT